MLGRLGEHEVRAEWGCTGGDGTFARVEGDREMGSFEGIARELG